MYQVMLVSFNNHTTDATSGTDTHENTSGAPQSVRGLQVFSFAQSVVYYVMFCSLLFVHCTICPSSIYGSRIGGVMVSVLSLSALDRWF